MVKLPGTMHVEDLLFVEKKLLFSREPIDMFESQISSQLKLIRTAQGNRWASWWSREIRQSLRYALFLRYYAAFESHLTTICDRFAKNENLPLRVGDIRAENFLKQVNKYLSRV